MSTSNTKTTPKHLKTGQFILITRRSDGLLKVAGVKRGSLIAELLGPPKHVANPSGTGKRGGYSLHTSEGVVPFVAGVANVMIAAADDRRRAERERKSREAAQAESQALLAGVNSPNDERPAASADETDAAQGVVGEWLAPTRSMRDAVADQAAIDAAAEEVVKGAVKRPTPADIPARVSAGARTSTPAKVAARAAAVTPAVLAPADRRGPGRPPKKLPPRTAPGVGARGDSDQHKPAVGDAAAANYEAQAAASKTDAARAYWSRLAQRARETSAP